MLARTIFNEHEKGSNLLGIVTHDLYSPLSHGGHIVPGDQKSFVLPR